MPRQLRLPGQQKGHKPMAPKTEHKRHASKHKIDRRLGVNLWGRSKSPLNTRSYAPGQHGQRRKKPTDFGIQLMAKQKLKGYYGNIGEKQFKKYYQKRFAVSDTGQNLIGILESRLDAVLYRSKLAPTVFAARQIINHGHVLLNGKRCNIGSVMLKAGDTLQLRDKAKAKCRYSGRLPLLSVTCLNMLKLIMTRCQPHWSVRRLWMKCLIRCRWNQIWWSNITHADICL